MKQLNGKLEFEFP